jgi:hypothetical protein
MIGPAGQNEEKECKSGGERIGGIVRDVDAKGDAAAVLRQENRKGGRGRETICSAGWDFMCGTIASRGMWPGRTRGVSFTWFAHVSPTRRLLWRYFQITRNRVTHVSTRLHPHP